MRTRIEAQCRIKGICWTAHRQVIGEILSASTDHPDIYELHRRATANGKRISLSTVYRTLKRFEREGVVERRKFRDGRTRYELVSRQHHDHLIDLTTGDVVEFRSPEIEKMQAQIVERLGYKLVAYRLELYGTPAKIGRSPQKRSFDS
jgi:Fur family ferric uptake transcriptional regulator